MIKMGQFSFTDKAVYPKSYLYNWNTNAWKDGLQTETGPTIVSQVW